MTLPANWVWVTDAPLDRATVVIDLDGVIADAAHRQRFLADGRRDWDGFFGACVDDTLIASGAALAAAIDDDHTVVILTARPDTIRPQTIAWLDRYGVRHDLLIVRPPDDPRSSAAFKRDEIGRLVAAGSDIRLAVDDSPTNLEAMREMGLPVLAVHSGYYDA